MSRIQAVSFDIYGTLLELDRPFERLQAVLADAGMDVSLDTAGVAFIAEMDYYRPHHLEGNTPEALNDLRTRCAARMFEVLDEYGCPNTFSSDEKRGLLMKSVEFRVYDEVLDVLAQCADRGVRVAVTSNWDCELDQVLTEQGLGDSFEVVTVSAVEGIAKPDADLYALTASRLGVTPAEILHVGDEEENDLFAAQRAGMQAVLLDRRNEHKPEQGRIASLAELPVLKNDVDRLTS